MADRTPEDREAARLAREQRRAAREGRAAPAPEPEPVPEPVPPPEPQPTQQFDVAAEWTGERPAVVTAEPESAPGPESEPEVPLGTRRVSAKDHPRFGARRAAPTPKAPRRWGRGHVLAVLLIAVVGLGAWFLNALVQPFAGDGGARVRVKIPAGATASQVGDLLAARGVIDSSFFFRLRAQLAGQREDIKSGTFSLREDMSYGAALDAITKSPPPPPVINVTIPEGLARREAAPLIRQAGVRGDYLKASARSPALNPARFGAPRGTSLEGFLFPATYELKRGATAERLVAEQLAALKERLAGVSLRYAHAKNLTVFDVLTIASMVEREVSVPRERRLVAAVIYNRLHEGMPLGIDATLRYALHNWSRPLRVSELASPSPYNTRNHQGLPPGPIGSPGLASIEAAAHPARVPYTYYVVKPGTCGHHVFSSSFAQFQRDADRYAAAREAAGGKSPTKC